MSVAHIICPMLQALVSRMPFTLDDDDDVDLRVRMMLMTQG